MAHKGLVQGGRRGEAKCPKFQVSCPDGRTVLRYQVVEGRAESEGVTTVTYAQENLSDPLNDALRAAVPVSRVAA